MQYNPYTLTRDSQEGPAQPRLFDLQRPSLAGLSLIVALLLTIQIRFRVLTDFDHLAGAAGGVFGALDHFAGDGVELGGFEGFGAGEGDGQAAVAAFANGRDKLDRS